MPCYLGQGAVQFALAVLGELGFENVKNKYVVERMLTVALGYYVMKHSNQGIERIKHVRSQETISVHRRSQKLFYAVPQITVYFLYLLMIPGERPSLL